MPIVQGHPVVVLPAAGIHKQTFGIFIIQEKILKNSNNNNK
jgi:hypothetical protein